MKRQQEFEKRTKSIAYDDPFRDIFLQVSKESNDPNDGTNETSIEEVDEKQEQTFEKQPKGRSQSIVYSSMDSGIQLVQSPQVVREQEPRTPDWQDEAYWRLPEKVRQAIDGAKQKSAHSEFYYRLQLMNDKVFVYKQCYTNQLPKFEKTYQKKKREEMKKIRKKKRQEENAQKIYMLNQEFLQ